MNFEVQRLAALISERKTTPSAQMEIEHIKVENPEIYDIFKAAYKTLGLLYYIKAIKDTAECFSRFSSDENNLTVEEFCTLDGRSEQMKKGILMYSFKRYFMEELEWIQQQSER